MTALPAPDGGVPPHLRDVPAARRWGGEVARAGHGVVTLVAELVAAGAPGPLVVAAVAGHQEQASADWTVRDRLTGLLDRAVLEEAVHREVQGARRHGAPAVVVVELTGLAGPTGFALTHGHLAADLLLVRAAELLRGASRGSDLQARLGEDQVAVLLPRTDVVRALVVARRVLGRLRVDHRLGSTAVPDLPRPAVGVGWLAAPRDAEEVLVATQEAVAAARSAGGWAVRASSGGEPAVEAG